MEYPRPDEFNGSKENYSIWRMRMYIYLSSPALRGANAQEKTSIVLSYIRGPDVNDWVCMFAEEYFDEKLGVWRDKTQAAKAGDEASGDGEGYRCQWDYDRFWEILDERFADRLRAVKARCNIDSLYMDQCSSAQEYFQKLEVYMHQAQWDQDSPYTLSVIRTHADESLVDIIDRSAGSRPGSYKYWKEGLVRLDLSRLKRGISRLAAMGPGRDTRASEVSEAPSSLPLQERQEQRVEVPQMSRLMNRTCFKCGRRRGEEGLCGSSWHRPQSPLLASRARGY